MLPAACQGVIGLEARLDDDHTRTLCEAIGDLTTMIAATAERAFQTRLDGSCRTPMAALATIEGDLMTFDALVARPDGTAVIRVSEHGLIAEAARLGDDIGQRIKAGMPRDFFIAAELSP
jgi:hydroxymethylbilane synthase